MKQPWFITGTDTEIGKTWCTLALIQHLKNQKLTVGGMKPIATGCYKHAGQLRNEDAENILKRNSLELPYEQVNPYAFIPPIAPHLAAHQLNQQIELAPIIEAYQYIATQVDQVIIEGIGGWRVPLNFEQSLKDLVLALQAKVILVVGLRLGCINHALLSAEVILQDGCQLIGWIANPIDPNFEAQSSIETLSKLLTVPLFAQMPYLTNRNVQQLADALPDMTYYLSP